MPEISVAVAGLGAVGRPVVEWLDRGLPGLRLAAISAGTPATVRARLSGLQDLPPVVPLDELPVHADIVVEALPPAKFFDLAEPVVEAGRILIAVTVSRLIERPDLVERARETGARIIVPTGAVAAFDAVRAAAHGTIQTLKIVTRKPPCSLAKSAFVIANGIDVMALTEPMCLYSGPVRGVASAFPANANVAVALSLAGPGPDRVTCEIWADPSAERNTHSVTLESDATQFELTIAGVPSEDNPATGRLTPYAVMATLEGFVSPLRIGS